MPLKAVFFDVGETLVDEERWWREFAERSALQPHVVWAALGVTIERGEEHDALWGHLGIERPATWWEDLSYSLEDLYPDAIPSLEAVRALGLRAGSSVTRPRRSSAGCERQRFPADVVSSSATLGVRKPDPRVLRADRRACRGRAGRGRVRGGPRRQRRRPGCVRRGSSPCICGEGRGAGSSRPAGGALAHRLALGAPRRVSLARVSELRVGIGFDAHALVEGVPLVLGGVAIDYPRGLAGHSDGDVVAHALIDALLGAANLGRHRLALPVRRRAVSRRVFARPALGGLPRGARRRLRARQRRLRPRGRGAANRRPCERRCASGSPARSASRAVASRCARRRPTASASRVGARGSPRRPSRCSAR